MMSFLGMCSYCRSFIPNYSQLEQPLSSLIHGKNLSAHDKIQWLPAASQAFTDMKCALQVPPTLGLPDPHKPFTQTVDERSGCMTSVLLQSHGDKLRPVAYFSAKLDPVAAGLPQCLRAVAAAEKALTASRDIVGYATLTLLVPHSVSLILLEQKSSHLSAARYLRYHTCLLDMPNVTVKRCNVLNPASLLPTPEDGEEHNCLAELEAQCTPRPDLADTPLLNSDMVMYVDGSATRDPLTGSNLVGFSVVSDSAVLCSGPLPCHLSAQAAELIALTEACKLAKDKTATIHTDSRYAFGVVHDFGALWRHRNFLKSDGKPVLHHTLIAELLDAILLPTAIAVCKCAAHTSGTGDIAKGNERADLAAKAAARRPLPKPSRRVPAMCSLPSSLAAVQSLSTSDERRFWSSSGSKFIDGIWYGPNVQVSHHAAHPPPARPFEHVMMDFVELSPSEGKKHCLVMVDMWSKWVEVFPSSKQTASTVAKALISEIIPRWGIPSKISSDNGSHFVNQAITELSAYLGIDLKTHCAYHPASGGAVERENGTLKTKLAKCCTDTGLPWTKALPLVLMYMRMRKRTRSNLSPFEILFAVPPHIGVEAPGTPLPSTTMCENDMLTYCIRLSSTLS
uniref:Uncharacterized protein n=1 Tax=Gasterosteus aculeatus aculeatus TaxID=481459 RepID=A0AAQ4QZA3_GASAC